MHGDAHNQRRTRRSYHSDLIPDGQDRDHAIGTSSPSITLVEFGDYECPYTAASHWQIQLLLKDFSGYLRFVFRHFPLQKKHLFAMRAAEAAEAAASQGKFWEMHATLLRHEYSLAWEGLKDAARAVGLDLPQFEKDVLNRRHRHIVQADISIGTRSGVATTPTYFVDGRLYEGPDNYDDFARLFESKGAVRSDRTRHP